MIYTISNEYMSVEISSKGGELQSVKTKDDHEYLWQGDPETWARKSPILFPMVGKLFTGTYHYKDKEYSMGQHGFLRDREFKLESLDDTKLILSYEDNEDTLKSYPFHFLFTVTYKLDKDTLCTSYDVKNNGDDYMYFGLGGHPGFKVPMDENTKFDDYYIQFEEGLSPVQTTLNEDYWFDNETVPYTFDEGNRINLYHDLFVHDAIILSDAGKTVEIKSDKSDRSILFNFDGFEFIAFWQAPNNKPQFVCVEPWTSHSSFAGEEETYIETKRDLIKLPAKETFNRRWSVTIK